MRLLRGHTDKVLTLAYSPDGRWLASGARGGVIRLWDVRTGEVAARWSPKLARLSWQEQPDSFNASGKNLSIDSMAFSPDGRLLAAGGRGTRVWLLDVGDTLTLRDRIPQVTNHTRTLAFSPDGGELAIASDRVQLWRLEWTEVGCTLTTPVLNAHPVAQSRVLSRCVAYGPQGEVVIAGQGRNLMTWEPNRDPSQVFLMTPLVGEVEYEGITVQTEFPGPIHGLVPSPNWHLLGVVLEKHIGIWGWEEGVRLATLESLFRLIPTMAWGPKEQTIVSGCKNGAVIEWDVARQLIRRTLDFEIGSINAVAVAPDGLTAAAAGDRDIVIWDLE